MLAETAGPAADAAVLIYIGCLRVLGGEKAAGRDEYRRGQEQLRSLGMDFYASRAATVTRQVELAAGDLAEAERVVRTGYEAFVAMGAVSFGSTTAALLSRALCLQRRYEDAERYIDICERTTGEGDTMNELLVGAIRARLHAAAGRLEEAREVAVATTKVACEVDASWLQGEAFVDLAEVLALAGRHEEAAEAVRTSLRYFTAKGIEPATARA